MVATEGNHLPLDQVGVCPAQDRVRHTWEGAAGSPGGVESSTLDSGRPGKELAAVLSQGVQRGAGERRGCAAFGVWMGEQGQD